MITIKPLKLGLLHRTYEANGLFYFCTAVISFFPLDSPSSLLIEPQLWPFVAAELGDNAVLDMCMPKARGEVLVSGKCYAQGGGAQAGEVQLKISSVNKKLYVFGDRYWKTSGLTTKSITEAESFTEIEISYGNAFGGADYPLNPLGKGFFPKGAKNCPERIPLPNIESPGRLVGSPQDTPDPAGFGPLDMMWPQRANKAGTYDQKWLEELFPGLARDMDPTFFNTAPEDQWIEGWFNGDENFEIKGMHPETETLQSSLPGIRPRCFITLKNNENEEFREIGLNPDTVWLFPHAQRGLVIHRGSTEIKTDDAEDIENLLVGYERLGHQPRSLEHYQEALLKRLDKENGYLYNIVEKDLIPPDDESGLVALIKKAQKKDSPLQRNIKARAAKEKENAEQLKAGYLSQAKAMAEAHGLDPEIFNPMPQVDQSMPQAPELDMDNFDPEEIATFMNQMEVQMKAKQENLMAQGLARREEAENQIKDLCLARGLDFEKIIGQIGATRPKRSVFQAEEFLQHMRKTKADIAAQMNKYGLDSGAGLDKILSQGLEPSEDSGFSIKETLEEFNKFDPDDPELIQRLQKAEEESRNAYRQLSAYQPKPGPLSEEEQAALYEEFLAVKTAGGSFAERDLAGIDLRGQDLRGLDLKDVYLEGADLSGADLSGADLSGAVLAWADLSRAVLTGARLHRTGLGAANLAGAEVRDAHLTEAVLIRSDLTGADFSGSNLVEAEIREALLKDTNLSGADLSKVIFLNMDFSGTDFSGADLSEAIFIKPMMSGVNFTGAKLTGATLLEASCEKAVFRNADLTNARFIQQAVLAGADFSGAVLDEANLMEADLTGAVLVKTDLNKTNLIKAKLNQADLTGIKARQSNFMKADLEGARMVGANLMEANLKGARLVNTDLKMASLYGAEVMRVVLGQTDLAGANLKLTKIANWRPDGQG